MAEGIGPPMAPQMASPANVQQILLPSTPKDAGTRPVEVGPKRIWPVAGLLLGGIPGLIAVSALNHSRAAAYERAHPSQARAEQGDAPMIPSGVPVVVAPEQKEEEELGLG